MDCDGMLESISVLDAFLMPPTSNSGPVRSGTSISSGYCVLLSSSIESFKPEIYIMGSEFPLILLKQDDASHLHFVKSRSNDLIRHSLDDRHLC
jgi:hypothetical protein